MSVKRSTAVLRAETFFEPGVPICVNRVCETFELAEHSHEFIEITYVSEGAGMHYIGDAAMPVEQGTLFFIPLGRTHVFRPRTAQPDRPLIVYNCLLPAEYLTALRASMPQAAGIVDSFAAPGQTWLSVKDASGYYHELFRELYREYNSRPPGFVAVLAALVLRILVGLHRHRLLGGQAPGERPPWLTIDDAIAYIDRCYAEELRLGELAARANLSERQFSRLFRRQTGMSFIGYVQNVRMDASCRLLSSGRMSVTEVAASVGYADLKFFHALFRKKTGVSPRRYRETHQNERVVDLGTSR